MSDISKQRGRKMDKFVRWIAWKLPKRLVMWCAVRVGAYATTGEYSNQIVPDLTFMDAMKRWKSKNGGRDA